MSEGEGDIKPAGEMFESLAHYQRLRYAVEEAMKYYPDEEGLSKAARAANRAKRRELVIHASSAVKDIEHISLPDEVADEFPSVARQDLRQENPGVIERAINKYWQIREGQAPMIVDAVHDARPNQAEIVAFVQMVYPEKSQEEILSSIAIADAKKAGMEGPLEEFDQFVQELRWWYDEETGKLAARIAELTGASLILAKKSRLYADGNRQWRQRMAKILKLTNIGEKKFYPREYSRSIKAALYWAMARIMDKTVGLDARGRLKRDFVRVSVHGMKGNPHFDIAVAGSRQLAEADFLNWFTGELNREMAAESDWFSDGRTPRAIVATLQHEIHEARSYAGTGIGYSHFREGSTKYTQQHPPFGNKLQSVQIEVGDELRRDEKRREKLAGAVSRVLKKMEEEYFQKRGRADGATGK